MRKTLLLIFTLLCTTALTCAPNEPLENVLRELDRTVASKREYELEKQLSIAVINSSAKSTRTARQRYELYQQLYEQYGSYNIDSAMFYALNKAQIAEQMGDHDKLVASEMDLAGVYTNAGMYAEACDILARYSNEARRRDIVFYYHICHSLTAGMYQNSEGSSLSRLLPHHVGLLPRFAALGTGHRRIISYCFVAWKTNPTTDAITLPPEMLTQRYNSQQTTDREKAILDYSLAVAALGDGDTEAAKLHYARSAITDLRTPVKEYKSLQELALLLYREGDVSRAYDYIMCSMEDVLASNTTAVAGGYPYSANHHPGLRTCNGRTEEANYGRTHTCGSALPLCSGSFGGGGTPKSQHSRVGSQTPTCQRRPENCKFETYPNHRTTF